jgi:hypothetical protein
LAWWETGTDGPGRESGIEGRKLETSFRRFEEGVRSLIRFEGMPVPLPENVADRRPINPIPARAEPALQHRR